MDRKRPAAIAACSFLAVLGSCASVQFDRTTETSGRFESTAWAFTIAKIDLPKMALQIAYENASDSNLANMKVEEVSVVPDWGWWNWVLDIISIRGARIRGTWGFDGEEQGESRPF